MGMLTSFVDPYIRNELKVLLADRNPRRIHEFYSDYLLLHARNWSFDSGSVYGLKVLLYNINWRNNFLWWGIFFSCNQYLSSVLL